jgi:hypothetical protein
MALEVIDQTWVDEWTKAFVTKEEADICNEWLKLVPPEWFDILQRFPLLCMVRSKRPLDVPYPFTVGIVTGYLEDGRLFLRQDPQGDDVPVDADDLEVAGFWKGLTTDVVRKLLPKRTPSHARHR